jgi:tetratricopeptide (TPR) repeat protein
MVIERGWITLAWIAPVALGAIAWLARRRAPALSAGVIVFVLALAPILGFVPFDFQAYSTVADHYMYLPMLGAALAIAWVATIRPHIVTRLAVLLIVAGLAVLARLQTRHWENTVAIFEHALVVNPRSWVAHTQLAAYDHTRGNYEGALHHAERAADVNPGAWPAYTEMGRNLAELRRPDDAVAAYRRALELNPSELLAHANLANLLADQGLLEEALVHYRAAVEINPYSLILRLNLAGALEESGDVEQAAREYENVLRRDPQSAGALAGLARINPNRPTSTQSTPPRGH